jgi:hypothetical protein
VRASRLLWKKDAEAVIGVGRVATMRSVCTRSSTWPMWNSEQNGAMPCASSVAPSERVSEHTTTSCERDRWRIMLNGRMVPPRLGG